MFGWLRGKSAGWDGLTKTLQRAGLWHTNSAGEWPSLSDKALEDLIAVMDIVYGCVREISTTASEPEIEVGRGTDEEWEPIENHWLTALLADPNPDYDWAMFIQQAVAHLMGRGQAFLWKWRSNAGKPAELWPMPPSQVDIQLGQSESSRLISGYKIQGNVNAVDPADMVYVRFPKPGSLYDGLGPLQVASRAVKLDEERQDYMRDMLANLTVAGLVFKSPTFMNTEQKTDLRSWFKDTYGGKGRGDPLTVEGEGAGVEMLEPLKDLDWPGLNAMNESRICMCFGVPPILIGARIGLERSTYSNYEEARRSFYQETMMPLWGALAGALTRGLLRAEGEGDTRIRFKTASLPALQEDADTRATRAGSLYQAGVITLAQAQAMAGVEVDPAGEFYVQGMATVRIPTGTEANDDAS